MYISWDALGLILSGVTIIIGAASAYLRYFFKAELNSHAKELLERIREDHPTKEVLDLRLANFDLRIERLEERAKTKP